jgi:hypothetical protein
MATKKAMASFRAIAELPSYQRVWMPVVAWKDAMRRETAAVCSDQAVSKAINKVVVDDGGKFFPFFPLSGVPQLTVFTHKYTVKKAGAKNGHLVTFCIVQSSAYTDPIIPQTDTSFWQKRYNRYAGGRFQPKPETRERKRQRSDDPNTSKEVDLTEEQVNERERKRQRSDDPNTSKEVDLTEEQVNENMEMFNELKALMKQQALTEQQRQDEERDNQQPPPSNEQDFHQWVRENWRTDFPNLPFPENFLNAPTRVDSARPLQYQTPAPPEPEKKIGRHLLNDYKLPSGHVIKDLPGNYCVVEAGQYGHLKQALRIVKAFSKHLALERARSSKLSKTINAAVTSALPTVPTTAQEIIIAFSRYTFLLDVKAQLDPLFTNDMDNLLDFQKILNSSPSARTLDDAVDDLATDQAMLASFEIQKADSVFLQSDKAPDGSEAMLLVWWRELDTRKTPFGSIRQFKALHGLEEKCRTAV